APTRMNTANAARRWRGATTSNATRANTSVAEAISSMGTRREMMRTKTSTSSPVGAADLPEVAQRAQKVARLDLRALHVVPDLHRIFVDLARHGVAPLHPDESRQDLDVEDPARQERAREGFAQRAARAEQLRAALRVVHGEAERLRDQRRAEAAEVVARGVAADL